MPRNPVEPLLAFLKPAVNLLKSLVALIPTIKRGVLLMILAGATLVLVLFIFLPMTCRQEKAPASFQPPLSTLYESSQTESGGVFRQLYIPWPGDAVLRLSIPLLKDSRREWLPSFTERYRKDTEPLIRAWLRTRREALIKSLLEGAK